MVVAMDATFWGWMLQRELRGELGRGYVVQHCELFGCECLPRLDWFDKLTTGGLAAGRWTRSTGSGRGTEEHRWG
jgi:hypothetical protein